MLVKVKLFAGSKKQRVTIALIRLLVAFIASIDHIIIIVILYLISV